MPKLTRRPAPLSPELQPFDVTINIPGKPDFSDFTYPNAHRIFPRFSVPRVGEDVTFEPAYLVERRNRPAMPEVTQLHVHHHSLETPPEDWRIILNLDTEKPLSFWYYDAVCDEDNGLTFSEARAGHYIESVPKRTPLKKLHIPTFKGDEAKGVAFRAGEVAHLGCAAEIVGNRAIIFAQQPELPYAEDPFRHGVAELKMLPYMALSEEG